MNRLILKMASVVLGLSFAFGATASAAIPMSLAPVKPNTIIIVIGPKRVVVVTRAVMQNSLEHVDQAAEFDSTN